MKEIKTIYVVIAILVVLIILGYVLSQSKPTKKGVKPIGRQGVSQSA